MLAIIKVSLLIMGLIYFSVAIGGLTAKVISTGMRGNYHYLQLFCGGILVGLLSLEVIPDAFNTYNPKGITLGILWGLLFMIVLENAFHRFTQHRQHITPIYLLLFVALVIHSIPTGVALGLTLHNKDHAHSSLLVAILVHHLPEGMTLMIAVLIAQAKTKVFWFLCLLLSFVIAISSFIGLSIALSLNYYIQFLGIAIGTLSYVTFYEIIWKVLVQRLTLKRMTFALLGILFFWILLKVK